LPDFADLGLVGIRIGRHGRLAPAILVEHDRPAAGMDRRFTARLDQIGGIFPMARRAVFISFTSTITLGAEPAFAGDFTSETSIHGK
jgi:hypothetical protein